LRQRALTIVAPVSEGEDIGALKASLYTDGGGLQGGGCGRFGQLETLHYLSCCVIEPDESEPALVVLELNFDGPSQDFLTDLVETWPAEIDRIFEHCDGYQATRGDRSEIVKFMNQRNQRANVFYLGHPGRSVKQIRKEEEDRDELRGTLNGAPPPTRHELWKELRDQEIGEKPPKLPFLVRYSLRGRRGPKRVAELARIIVRASAMLAGVAAFCAFAVLVSGARGYLALAVCGPALLAFLCVLRLRPRHLALEGSALARREALWQGARVFVYFAVLVGAFVALFPPVSEQWLPFSVWAALDAAVPWAVGLVLTWALLVAITTAAHLLLGGIAGLLAGAIGLALAAWGCNVVVESGLSDTFLYVGPVVAALFLATVGVAAVVYYLPRLRRRERQDDVAPARWNNAHLACMTKDEDRQFQNHFASVTTVKDGVRLWQLRAVLRLIQLLAKIYFNQGTLGTIPSIHFARFMILKEKGRRKKRLLFLTNYDGAWPNYLGEFSHVSGVTLVWGSAELFPRPFLVADDGARDEQRFKTWARNSQIKTLIWYSAYPDLSVVQVNRNTQFSESLARPLEDEAPRFRPLQPFWRHFKRPLNEAALDAELRSLTN
jgi:hypothetical protein